MAACPTDDGLPHGRASTYTKHHCRGDECTRANTLYMAQYRANRRAGVTRSGEPLTGRTRPSLKRDTDYWPRVP
jgi:hypothetical protein